MIVFQLLNVTKLFHSFLEVVIFQAPVPVFKNDLWKTTLHFGKIQNCRTAKHEKPLIPVASDEKPPEVMIQFIEIYILIIYIYIYIYIQIVD